MLTYGSMKSWQIIVAIVVVLVGLYIFVLTRTSNQVTTPPVSSDTMIYYWSITCPHCKNVSDFLSTWPNTDKLKLEKREVSENRTNQVLFTEAGKKCNIPPD